MIICNEHFGPGEFVDQSQLQMAAASQYYVIISIIVFLFIQSFRCSYEQ